MNEIRFEFEIYIQNFLQEIIAHNRSVHSKEFPFVCETCGESYSRRQQFHAHVEAHNKKEFKSEL